VAGAAYMAGMLSHVSVGTNDLENARVFYTAVMKVLGLNLLNDDGESLDYGSSRLMFSVESPTNGQKASPGNGVHIAFEAHNRAMVDAVYKAALAHGGKDAGAPGLRPQYDAHYYATFVEDPDGNKLEVVTLTAA